MLAFLEGKIAFKGTNSIYLNVGGVGFELLMAHRSIATLPPAGEQASVFCYLAVSDTALTLYGFVSEDEKSLFDSLTGVSGVGPKTALAALSVFTPKELISAIANQDIKAVSRIPGVGKKSASRIILELKDKFDIFDLPQSVPTDSIANDSILGLVTIALKDLGFSDSEIRDAVEGADPSMDEKALLQYSLKRLGR